MNLTVNTAAAAGSSFGVQRYFEAVMRHLPWPGTVDTFPAGRWRRLERPRELLHRGRPDAVFWTPCQRGPLRAHHHVVTVHDCINVEYVHRDDWRLPIYRLLFNTILDGAERVVAISSATRDAILRNYRVDESKLTVIRSGRDSFVRQVDGRLAAEAHAGRPYVLLVTNALAHKNNLAACEAFARSLGPGEGLVLRVVGSLPDDARAACHRHGVMLEEHSRIDDAQLAAWYAGCRFLLSPSLAEGHNLPIAEALAQGANVLCTDIPVHREFYDGEVRFFEPGPLDAFVQALDAAIATDGPWFKVDRDVVRRSFADVARDYADLFNALAPVR